MTSRFFLGLEPPMVQFVGSSGQHVPQLTQLRQQGIFVPPEIDRYAYQGEMVQNYLIQGYFEDQARATQGPVYFALHPGNGTQPMQRSQAMRTPIAGPPQ